jgi:hypothetical protein
MPMTLAHRLRRARQHDGRRWSAGIGATDHGTVLHGSEQTWPSRRAVVAWVIQHAGGAR